MDIITLCLLLGVASGVLHPAQGCKILVYYEMQILVQVQHIVTQLQSCNLAKTYLKAVFLQLEFSQLRDELELAMLLPVMPHGSRTTEQF